MAISDPARGELPLLSEGAARLGFNLGAREIGLFQRYYEMLVDWNRRVNLTAITDYEGVQVRHFVDSLTVGAALLEELGKKGERPTAPPHGFAIADVGTGAGFPGVPLKTVWPQIKLMVNDSIGKKTAFLDTLAEALGLRDVEVVTARAEDLGQKKLYRERYDAVTARAVASLPVLCEYCLPLAKIGGFFLAPKKGDISQELEGAGRAASLLGGDRPRLHSFRLPGEEGERYVVVIRKVRATPPGYPRRVGLAKAKPLG